MVTSVTEGEDKPLKYPLMFRACELVLINKIDLLPHLDFDLDKLLYNLDPVHPGRRAHARQRPDRRGHRRVARLARGDGGARGGAGVRAGRLAACDGRVAGALAERRTRGERGLLRRRGRAPRAAAATHGGALRARRPAGRARALARGPLRRPARGGRVRPPRDRRQAGAAGARRRRARAARWPRRSALLVEPDDIAIAFGDDGRGRAPRRGRRPRARLPDDRLRARRGRVGVRPAERRPGGAPGARRDALPRALGARARVLRAPRAARGPRRARRCTTPARRASSTRSSASRRTTSRRCVEDVRRSVLMKAERGRRAARADAHREPRASSLAAAAALRARSTAGGKLLALGNGGSATDAMDVVADFRHPPAGWPARPAIDLTEDPAILTAIANDIGDRGDLRAPGDRLRARGRRRCSPSRRAATRETSSRRSPRRAAGGCVTIAMVGYDGGRVAAERLADHVVVTASEHIPRIQEAQASAYHVLRELVELAPG